MADITSAKQLREDRAPLAHQIMSLNDKVQAENRDFNAEEREQWDRLNSEYNLFTNRIQIAERTESILTEQNSPIDEQPKNKAGESRQLPGREDYDGRKALEKFENAGREVASPADQAMAMQAWARVQEGMSLTDAHNRACRLTGVNPREKLFHANIGDATYNQVRRDYRNALSGNSVVGGAGTRPEGFVSSLEVALLAYAQLRQVAEVIRTTDGNPMTWPTADNTSNTGYIVGENQSNTTSQDPLWGKYVLSAYEYTSGFCKIPNSFLTDSACNLAQIVGEMQGEMIGRRQATDFTTGTGTNQATGFVTACVNSSATSAAASATAISFDDLYGLKHSVDPAYRGLGCQWMMHDSILLAVRKLKDGNGQYLWQPSRITGMPDTLDGDPLFINQAMDSTIASGKYTVAYGLFSKYKIRDVNDVIMRRADERYIENNQTGFIAFLRSDGNLLDAGRKPIKLLSH